MHMKHQKHLPKFKLKVGDHAIESVPCVKNLGVIFDHYLTMVKQVSSIVKSCHFRVIFRYAILCVYGAKKPAKPWLTL